MTSKRSDYATGVILLIAAALTYSTAGIFTKGVVAEAWASSVQWGRPPSFPPSS